MRPIRKESEANDVEEDQSRRKKRYEHGTTSTVGRAKKSKRTIGKSGGGRGGGDKMGKDP